MNPIPLPSAGGSYTYDGKDLVPAGRPVESPLIDANKRRAAPLGYTWQTGPDGAPVLVADAPAVAPAAPAAEPDYLPVTRDEE